MGWIVLQQRADYFCPRCHRGHCPADAAFGLGAHDLTPGAEPLISPAGTVAGFAEAATKLLPKMAGLRLAESTVERTTEAAGVRWGAALAAGPTFGAAVVWAGPADAQGRPTAYVSINATGIGMQGPGGVAAEGRMVWVGKVSAPRTEPDDSLPNRPAAVERARYLAGSMDRDGLGAQLRRQAAQVDRDRAERGVALTDGGSGLEDFMRVHFPRAERILGFDHAAEHLAELAQAVHGGAAEAAEVQAEGWAHQMRHEGVGRSWGPWRGWTWGAGRRGWWRSLARGRNPSAIRGIGWTLRGTRRRAGRSGRATSRRRARRWSMGV
jgi:hypothetical protein